jgi:hypothetical protein
MGPPSYMRSVVDRNVVVGAHNFVLHDLQVEEPPDNLRYRICIAQRIFHSKLKHLVGRGTS